MSNKILIITVFFFTNISTAVDFSEYAPALNKSEELIIDTELNQMLDQGLAQLNHFEHTIDYLALLIYNEPNKFDKSDEILNYIKETRELIAQIKRNSFIVPALNTINLINTINLELTQNISLALNTNVWRSVDLNSIIKRDLLSEISFEQIQDSLAQTQVMLDQLQASIERFGLSTSQKIVRKIEDCYDKSRFYIQKHKLENKIKYGLATSLIGAYCLYHTKSIEKSLPFTKKLLNNPIANLFKKVVGAAPEYKPKIDVNEVLNQQFPTTEPTVGFSIHNILSGMGFKPKKVYDALSSSKYKGQITNGDDLKALGKLEAFVSGYVSTDTSPAVLLPGAALGYLTHEAFEKNDSILLTYGLYLSKNPVVRMMAITNNLLDLKKGNRYSNLKKRWSNWLKQKYAELRGKSSQSGLASKPTMTFDDIIGLDHAKKEFEPVIDYIINPDKFERSKLTPNRGYLMIGAPRTGKSYIAQAICGEINARQKLLGKPKTTSFIPIDAAWINENSFYEIMEYINQQAPCIVFIDEIDLLALNRGDGGKENKLLSQILTHMSGKINFEGNDNSSSNQKQVIFIAATNNPHNLDSALLQSGRFGKIIAFNYPKLAERKQFMMQELKKRSIALEDGFIDEICQELEGNSFEDLSLIITGAIQKATSAYVPVGETHFRATIEETIKGVMTQTQALSDQEIATISSYQAGKALALKLLMPNLNISTVTIKPINKKIISQKNGNTRVNPVIEQGGIFSYKNNHLLDLKNMNDLMLECQIMLAGHIAQELLIGSSCYTYRPDDQQVASQIAKMIALEGDNYDQLTPDLKEEITKKAFDIKNQCKQKVRELLTANLDKLRNINLALQDKTSLSEKELASLLN